MQPDPMLVAETRAWFTKAANDLRAAQHEFTAAPPLLGDVVFHCQQAAEKAMKGFLTWHNVPFRRIHSLEEIGEPMRRSTCGMENPTAARLCEVRGGRLAHARPRCGYEISHQANFCAASGAP